MNTHDRMLVNKNIKPDNPNKIGSEVVIEGKTSCVREQGSALYPPMSFGAQSLPLVADWWHW